MNPIDKTLSADITLGQLLDAVAAAPDAPLIFHYDGRPVKSGVYVTEEATRARASGNAAQRRRFDELLALRSAWLKDVQGAKSSDGPLIS